LEVEVGVADQPVQRTADRKVRLHQAVKPRVLVPDRIAEAAVAPRRLDLGVPRRDPAELSGQAGCPACDGSRSPQER
jgi:hypothetical protein